MKHALPAQRRLHPAVAVATVIEFEDVGDRPAHASILVRNLQARPMIEVGAAGKAQLGQEIRQRMGLFEGVNQQRLLPVRQELQVDAQAFFYYFVGLLQEVVFELQTPDVATKRFDLPLQLRSLGLRLWWQIFAAFHGCWNLRAGELVLPVVQRRPAHAKLLSNRLRTSLASAQFEDRRFFNSGGRGALTALPTTRCRDSGCSSSIQARQRISRPDSPAP